MNKSNINRGPRISTDTESEGHYLQDSNYVANIQSND